MLTPKNKKYIKKTLHFKTRSLPARVTSITVKSETVHTVTQANYPKEIHAEMLVEEKHLKFQVDSGASVNIIPARIVEGTEMQTTTNMLQMWNDAALKPQGSCRVRATTR